MSGFRIAIIVLLALSPCLSDAQIKIVPQHRLDSLASPTLSPFSKDLRFDTTYIVADEMSQKDAPKVFRFAFVNTSAKPLVIYNVTTNCSCVKPMNIGTVVKAGERGEVVLKYDPAGHPGRFIRRIYVYTTKETAPTAFLRIEMTVK